MEDAVRELAEDSVFTVACGDMRLLSEKRSELVALGKTPEQREAVDEGIGLLLKHMRGLVSRQAAGAIGERLNLVNNSTELEELFE